MWTRPETPEQQRYYSKHAPERQVYGWIMTLMQLGHAMLAFAAWNAVYGWALEQFSWLYVLVPVLAGFTLMALHVLFRTTWETYWYDKLDNDPQTDSPIIVPILIIIGLLGCEVYGAGKFLESKVEVAQKIDAKPISAEHQGEVANLRRQFSLDSARIVGVYAPKIAAAALPYQAKINRMKATPAKDYEEAKWIRAQVKSLQAQADHAIAPVLAQQADELAIASNGISARIKSAYERHDRSLSEVETKNRNEDSRYQSELANTGPMSWILSVFLLGIIAVLGYRRVRINVMSGILPLRQYTILDAHGSAVERIWTALSDAMNRRWLQFAVWLHRWLSPNHALTSFDGTVVTRPGEYNTPEGFAMGNTLPQQAHQKTREQAESEVLAKLARNPGVKLDADQFAAEVRHSMASNGHYKDAPFPKGPSPTNEMARKRAAVTAGFEDESPNTVSQPSQPVSQPNDERTSVGAAEALLNIRTVLMRETNNLERGNGVVASILKRMEAALWKAIELHETPNFFPGVAVYQLFGDYIFGEFSNKMQALRANALEEDTTHYQFIWNSRIEYLKQIMSTTGAKTQIITEQ